MLPPSAFVILVSSFPIMLRSAFILFIRLLTGASALWQGCDPREKKLRIYFANHGSHLDFVTLWAALRVFDLQLSVPVLVLAYGTGWALTRRSLPFGGPGVVEILLVWVLTWFHLDFGAAAAGVVAYRLFNLWLALLPALIVLPFGRALEREMDDAPRAPPA